MRSRCDAISRRSRPSFHGRRSSGSASIATSPFRRGKGAIDLGAAETFLVEMKTHGVATAEEVVQTAWVEAVFILRVDALRPDARAIIEKFDSQPFRIWDLADFEALDRQAGNPDNLDTILENENLRPFTDTVKVLENWEFVDYDDLDRLIEDGEAGFGEAEHGVAGLVPSFEPPLARLRSREHGPSGSETNPYRESAGSSLALAAAGRSTRSAA